MKNKFAFIVLILLVIVLVMFFLKDKKQKPQTQTKESKGVPIIVGKVETKSIDYVLHQVGTLVASQEVNIRTEAKGNVVDIFFNEGSSVKKGDLLVKLDDAKTKTEIQSLEAKVDQLEVRLKNRKKSLERNRSLVKQNLVSEERFDDMVTGIDEIKSQIIQSKAGLNRMKESLADTLIRAPFDGVAGSRTFSVGHYLRVGEPVVSLVNLNELEIEFKVPEKYKRNIFLEQSVNLTVDAYQDQKFKGQISFIDPEVEVRTRTFLVKARVQNSDHLLNPGMFAKAELITEVHENAIMVPWESIIQMENETYLYSTDGKTAKKHSIVLGKNFNDQIEVMDTALSPGENIIIEGKFSVKDGGPVDIYKKAEEDRPEEKTLKTAVNPNQ